MKMTLKILTGLYLLLTSCNNTTTNDSINYIEIQPAFFELRNGDWLSNEWIRKSENLLTVHETFKRFGYEKLIPDHLLNENPLIIQDIYVNRPGRHLLDSLELTYSQTDIKEKYFKEFWQRRKAEKNDSAVYIIIRDINSAIKKGQASQDENLALVNDTLMQLLQIDYRTDSLTEQLARHDFETLRRLGFHQSAYNLLFENCKYQEFKWDKDSLEKTLKKSNKYTYPWVQDDTK